MKAALKGVTRGVIGSEAVHQAAQGLWNEIKIAQMSWVSQESFQALKGRSDLKVHFGCEDDIRLGWVNIDFALVPPPGFDRAAHSDTPLISYDLRQGLPLDEESCAMIYSSHLFEHMEYQHGLRLMQECYRVLKPGGAFRVCMPNYTAGFIAYLQGDRDFYSLMDYGLTDPEHRLLADYMTYSVYQHGEHICFYDEERFQFILSRIGFRSVKPTTFHAELDIRSEARKKYSYYIEAVK